MKVKSAVNKRLGKMKGEEIEFLARELLNLCIATNQDLIEIKDPQKVPQAYVDALMALVVTPTMNCWFRTLESYRNLVQKKREKEGDQK